MEGLWRGRAYKMGHFKEAGDRELKRMMAMLHSHAAKDGTGPWLVDRFGEIAAQEGPLSKNDVGFAHYYLLHYLGSPVEMLTNDHGEVIEVSGPKRTLRRPTGSSGRWKEVKG